MCRRRNASALKGTVIVEETFPVGLGLKVKLHHSADLMSADAQQGKKVNLTCREEHVVGNWVGKSFPRTKSLRTKHRQLDNRRSWKLR